MSVIRTTISFRDDSPLGALHSRNQDDAVSFSRAVVDLAARYAVLVERDLPAFSPTEWGALIGAHWSHLFTQVDYQSTMGLRGNVEDAGPEEWHEWGITQSGVKALSKKIRNLTTGQHFSVVEKLQELRRTHGVNAFLASLDTDRAAG